MSATVTPAARGGRRGPRASASTAVSPDRRGRGAPFTDSRAAATAARATRAGVGATPRRRPAAEEGVSPELRVVSSARRQRRWQIGALACIGLLVVLFGISAAQTFLVQQQRNIDDLNLRISEAEDRAEDLRLEMARLRSPQRIIDEATNRLGMVPAPVPVYLLPRATDDERAAEQPPPSPTTTVATSSSASEVRPSDSSSPVNEDPTGVVR